MDIYQTDDQKAEMIMKYLKENKKAIILALILFTCSFFGMKYYRHHNNIVAEQASSEFGKMFESEREQDFTSVETYANKIKANHKKSPYANLAAMKLAKIAYDNNNYDLAKENLAWIVNNKSDGPLYHIALLRLARIYRNEGNYEQALKLLDKDPDGFVSLYEEVKGDIYFDQNKLAKAKESYAKALKLAPKTGAVPWLQLKIEDLAGVDAKVSAPQE